jgi:hypothetical protein
MLGQKKKVGKKGGEISERGTRRAILGGVFCQCHLEAVVGGSGIYGEKEIGGVCGSNCCVVQVCGHDVELERGRRFGHAGSNSNSNSKNENLGCWKKKSQGSESKK